MDEPLQVEKECNMKHVPNWLECSYCIRSHMHGGECNCKVNNQGCMIFKPDARGCIRNKDFKIAFSIYQEIPLLNVWQDGWTVNDIPTEIKIVHIYGLTWNKTDSCLIVHCNCNYFVNEYSNDYVEAAEKPKLTIIK